MAASLPSRLLATAGGLLMRAGPTIIPGDGRAAPSVISNEVRNPSSRRDKGYGFLAGARNDGGRSAPPFVIPNGERSSSPWVLAGARNDEGRVSRNDGWVRRSSGGKPSLQPSPRGRGGRGRSPFPSGKGDRGLGPSSLAPFWLTLLVVGFALLVGTAAVGQAQGETVLVLPTRGVVNPVLASYIGHGIDLAKARGAEAVVVQLDTPGGLESSMREIVQATLASEVPVVFYVYPPGGRAASAGLFLTMAGHVAAMAPNTNIGSAHPVGGEGQQLDETMSAKVTNDAVALIRGLAERRGRNADWAERAVRESVNVSAEEAQKLGVVDLVAPDLPSLLRDIDGREVQLVTGPRTLRTAGKPVETVEMGFLERLLHLLSDPTIAYILMTVGVYGLIYELASPGAIVPGVAGVLALVLALYSLGTLPVNYAALVLLVFGFGLMIADVTLTPGVGALAAGGLLALLFGSLLLLYTLPPYLTLSPFAIAGVVGTTAIFFLIVMRGVVRSSRRPAVMGEQAMVGRTGTARSDFQGSGGMVFVSGELWRARSSNGPIASGDAVEVVGIDGLTLVVRKAG